jgi:hypothetical protein
MAMQTSSTDSDSDGKSGVFEHVPTAVAAAVVGNPAKRDGN